MALLRQYLYFKRHSISMLIKEFSTDTLVENGDVILLAISSAVSE
jgi:hypothetical protein